MLLNKIGNLPEKISSQSSNTNNINLLFYMKYIKVRPEILEDKSPKVSYMPICNKRQ